MRPRTVDLLLHLDILDDVVNGTLEDGQGRRWPFYGWLELGSLLDLARSRTDADAAARTKHPLEPIMQTSSASHTGSPTRKQLEAPESGASSVTSS